MARIKYSDQLGREICDRIAGGESTRAISADMKISLSAIMDWLTLHKQFAEQYSRARELQADLLAEQILELATAERGGIDPADDNADTQHRRLAIDALKWRAGKLRPKVYGDKILQEHTGGDGQPLILKIVTGVPTAPALPHEDAPLLEAPDAPDEDIPA